MLTRLPLLIIALMLWSTAALAQRWEGSIKVGTASTTFRGDLAAGETTWNRRLGFAAGTSLGYKLRYGFTPAVEFSYVRRGASTAVIFLDVPATLQSNLTYLTSSLLLQYRLYSGGYVYPRIFAGPVLANTLNAQISVSSRDGLGVITEQDDSIEEWDQAFVVGGGIDAEIASQVLTLELRYYLGQRDVTKPNPELGESVLQNAGVIIMIGILF